MLRTWIEQDAPAFPAHTGEPYILAQIQGENGALFRQSEPAKKATDELHRAQAEADIRCF